MYETPVWRQASFLNKRLDNRQETGIWYEKQVKGVIELKSQKTHWSLSDAAEILGVDPQTLRNEIARDRLQSLTIGNRYYVSRSQLSQYLGEAVFADIFGTQMEEVK